MLANGHLEFDLVIGLIGLSFADVPLHARATQHRPRYAVSDGIFPGEDAHVPGAVNPDAVLGKELFVLIDFGQEVIAKFHDFLFEPVIEVVLQPPDPEGVRGEARTAVLFEDLQDFLALSKRVKNRRHRPQVERVGAEPNQMAGNALQFRQDHAGVLCPRWNLHSQELLNGLDVSHAVGHGRDVIHTIDVRSELLVGAVLRDLLDAAVQVADNAFRTQHALAIQL